MICVPIVTPSFSYTMNGVTLDTPLQVTAPLLQGGSVLIGSSFGLIFGSPAASTQNALVNGVSGTMTFAAHDGSVMNGNVKVASTSIGSLFVVTLTVLSLLAVNKVVMATQFY